MTQKQNLSKDNHYVPQFYLKGFSQDGENIYRLDKETAEIKLLPIVVVGLQKNFYKFKTKDGTFDTLEPMFAQMEGMAQNVIQKLRISKEISDQEKADLSIFLSMQMLRTPASKNHLQSAQKELAIKVMRMKMSMTTPEMMQNFFQRRGKKMSKEEALDIIDFGSNEERSDISIDIPQEYWLNQMLKMAMDLCPLFQICDWEIRHSVTPFGFLTSDHPYMLIPGEKPDPFFGVGMLTPQAKKVFPLASDICLIAHEPKEEPKIYHTPADKAFFRKLNLWSVKNAEKYVFSPDQGKIEKIIKMNKESLLTPKRYSVS